ncbi:hypothetical protein B0H19DRAFT_1259027 [Mycena capillaripes]|nr:hypothetical protein B0H19DRAFT_1259027 [Mycena capillaripes]
MRLIGASPPISGPLGLRFNDRHVEHLPVWRSLVHLAKHFRFVPNITLTFPGHPVHKLPSDFMKTIPRSVASLMCATALRPIFIINFLTGVCVRPHRVPAGGYAPAAVDKETLTRRIQILIAATIKQEPLSMIHILSFPSPTTPLGSLAVIEPDFILSIDVDAHAASLSEWQFVLTHLELPNLRRLRIQVDLEYDVLSSFLHRHAGIQNLDFRCDWSGLRNEPHGRFPELSALKHISGSTRMIALALQRSRLPGLKYVCIGDRDTSSAANFQGALKSVAACSSVKHLMVQLHNAEPPWNHFNVETGATAERDLAHIQRLHISPWTHEVENDEFPHWLAMFPALKTLEISGDLFPISNKPLVSEGLITAIGTICPHIVVTQEQHFV